jgi:hypothetical protein
MLYKIYTNFEWHSLTSVILSFRFSFIFIFVFTFASILVKDNNCKVKEFLVFYN